MSDTAVWLTEHVIPRVQIRQWVLTLPWGLRARAGYDRQLCALVVDRFVRELMRSYRWRAKRLFGLSNVDDAFTGTVTVIQRFDSALRLNVHFHTLVLDGVYVKGDDGLQFLRLARPSEDEVHEVAFRTAEKVVGISEKKGRSVDGASSNDEETEISRRFWRATTLRAKRRRRESWMVRAWAKENAPSSSRDSMCSRGVAAACFRH